MDLILNDVGGKDGKSVLVFGTSVFLVVGLLEFSELSSEVINNFLSRVLM